MALRESLVTKIERHLDAGDNEGALKACNDFLAQSPSSFVARFGRARANLRLANYVDAETDIELALALSPKDEHARVVRANMDLRLGKIDKVIEGLTPIARGRGPHAVEAAINLMQTLQNAGRIEQLKEEVKVGGAWTKDLRALLIFAHVKVAEDREAGIAELVKISRDNHPMVLRRHAGFEAVGLLDKSGRYREAFDLATTIHRISTAPVNMDEWNIPLQHQLSLLQKGAGFFKPRCEPVHGAAFIVGMPRSGTTLLEQMLDRHPAIGGIGEFDGLDMVCRSLFAQGVWPRMPAAVPDPVFAQLQKRYLDGARQIRKEGATWTFDKSLRTWRGLPEVASVFPGAVCINVDRDPRDMATSIFLSYFNPTSYEWTQSFSAIRQMAEWQRKIVPVAFEVLGLSNERIVYEDLVEDPALYAGRCLERMGLPMDERVLSPEQNTKGAFTLSHAQVRQPINRKSIGRWKNYEWAFDSSWDAVVAAHEARRLHK